MADMMNTQQDHGERIGRLEGIAEQLDRRFDSIERRFDSVEHRFNSVERRLDNLERGFRWMMGIQITTLLGTIGIIIALLR